jgi:hypothetical protein
MLHVWLCCPFHYSHRVVMWTRPNPVLLATVNREHSLWTQKTADIYDSLWLKNSCIRDIYRHTFLLNNTCHSKGHWRHSYRKLLPTINSAAQQNSDWHTGSLPSRASCLDWNLSQGTRQEETASAFRAFLNKLYFPVWLTESAGCILSGSEKCCYRTFDLINTRLLPELFLKMWLPKPA